MGYSTYKYWEYLVGLFFHLYFVRFEYNFFGIFLKAVIPRGEFEATTTDRLGQKFSMSNNKIMGWGGRESVCNLIWCIL